MDVKPRNIEWMFSYTPSKVHVTYMTTAIGIDQITFGYEDGKGVHQVNIGIHAALSMGIIDFDKLYEYIKGGL